MENNDPGQAVVHARAQQRYAARQQRQTRWEYELSRNPLSREIQATVYGLYLLGYGRMGILRRLSGKHPELSEPRLRRLLRVMRVDPHAFVAEVGGELIVRG